MVNAIFDSASLFARSYYAARNDITKEPDPERTITLALNTVFSLLDPDEDTGKLGGARIDRVLFAWDGAHNPLKKRADKPKIYHETRLLVRDVFSSVFGGATYEHEEYEADDIVATAACANLKDTCYVISTDKDLMQLKSKRVHFYCLNTKAVLSQAYICNKFHVKHPSHIAIALAIAGDSGDSIAGIKGWGPKKVQKLFESVPLDASLESALATVEAQIPSDRLDEFYASFTRTLLNPEVPGVPLPAPVSLVGLPEMLSLGIPFDQEKYARAVRAYDDIPYD